MKHLLKHSLSCALLLPLISWAFVPTARAEEPANNLLPLTVFKNLQSGKQQAVVVYGTSLSDTSEWPKAFKAYFDKRFPGQVSFTNAASSGKQSNWGVANLESRVLSLHPDLLLIEFSMNDAATKHQISPELALANLDRMVKSLRQQNPQVDIVLQTMNTVFDGNDGKQAATARPNLETYYEGYRKYANEQGLPLIDHYPNWRKLQQEDEATFKHWLPDGTHPAPKASLAVTWPAIETLLEKARVAAAKN